MEYDMAKNMEKWKTQELAEHGYTMPVYLGAGADSQVWRVWDMSAQCFAVCKISRADKRAERESEVLKSLLHPVFPKYKAAWNGRDCSFLVMEYVPGSNLREMVHRRGRFTWKQAVYITVELAEGLLFLHERSHPVLFRDLKPDNVMIRQDGRVKLIDVGCACYEGETRSVAGSRGYSAPEQFVSGECPGVESDVYALGKLLYFMLTGQEGGMRDPYITGKENGRILKKGRRSGTNRTGSMARNRRRNNLWIGIPYGLRCLVEEAVCGERRERLPDMRSFLQKLVIYNGNQHLKRLHTDWRARIYREKAADFYYVQNLRRGTER